MNRSILLISYYFPPLGMAGVQRPLELAKGLYGLGWKVYVLTVKPISYWETDPTLLENFPKEIPVHRAGSADPARLAYLFGRKQRGEAGSSLVRKAGVWDSKLGFVPFACLKAARLVEKFGIAAVWTSSPPPSLHLVGRWLKRKKKIYWIADFRDPWEVEAPEENSFLWKKRKNKLKSFLQKADGLTAVNDCLKTYLQNFSEQDRVITVFNGYEPGIRPPAARSPSEILTLAYGGTLNSSHNPRLFLQALSRWKKESARPFRLLLVGKVIGLPLRSWLDELDLTPNVEITGYLPHRLAVEKVSTADVVLLFLPTEPCYRLNLPAKIFEYIGLGKPVLAVAGERSAVADFLDKYPAGKLCHGEDEIMERLEQFYHQWESGSIPEIPDSLRRQFGWDKQVERLSSFVETGLI